MSAEGNLLRELREALEAIRDVPSESTLLLNAEARAMYEIAQRALAEVDRCPELVRGESDA